MADDIVTRLRKPNAGVNSDQWHVMRRTMSEAADEIERLRDLLERAAVLLSSYGDGSVIYPDEQAVIDEVRNALAAHRERIGGGE